MCRTARSHPDGGCFSERLPASTSGVTPSLPARHGCTNLLIESKESFKCDNNNLNTVNRKTGKGSAVSQMTTVMCCHEDMCNHEGTAGRGGSATKGLQQLQQRIKLNQQRDVASAPSSSSSSAAAALTGTLKNSSGAAAASSAVNGAALLPQNGECVVNNNINPLYMGSWIIWIHITTEQGNDMLMRDSLIYWIAENICF